MGSESSDSGQFSNWHTHINNYNEIIIMKLNVYYHIWAPYNEPLVRFLIDDQIKRLDLNSLTHQATINVCVVGSAAKEIEKYLKVYDNIKVRKVVTQEKGWELHTLKVLYDDCKKNEDQYVMYMHTKGLQHYYNSTRNPSYCTNINTWRQFMEYVCIDSWRQCIKDLHEYDAVGMNLMRQPFVHFSGNFWWSRGSHIVKLPDPLSDMDNSPAPDRPDLSPRHQAEAWIGKAQGKFKTRLQIPGSMYSSSKFNQYKIVTAQ